MNGGVAKVWLKILLRDFDAAELAAQAELLGRAAGEVMRQFPGAKIEIDVQRQYRNMADGLVREPRAAATPRGLRRLGRTPKRTIAAAERTARPDGTGAAHAESVLRRIQSAFAPEMALFG